jgi:IS30 family transposase
MLHSAGVTITDIAKMFDKHHSTIIHALQVLQSNRRRDLNKEVNKAIDFLKLKEKKEIKWVDLSRVEYGRVYTKTDLISLMYG